MSTTYRPHADSLAGNVLAFFSGNLDESLTLDDIVTKWGAARGGVHTSLARAVSEKLLARVQNPDGEYVYGPGPQLGQVDPPEAKPITKAPSGYASPRQNFDFESLAVEEGIPFTPGAKRGQNKWEPLFDKLTKPGQSVAIPATIKPAVLAAACKRNKEKRGTFRVQLTSANEARVWRTA